MSLSISRTNEHAVLCLFLLSVSALELNEESHLSMYIAGGLDVVVDENEMYVDEQLFHCLTLLLSKIVLSSATAVAHRPHT